MELKTKKVKLRELFSQRECLAKIRFDLKDEKEIMSAIKCIEDAIDKLLMEKTE